MRLLVYCIVAAPEGEVAFPDGVSLVETAGIAAAVSPMKGEPRPEPNEVLAFEAVVEWFHARWPAVIPVRFGSVFPDAAAVVESLEGGLADYRRKLDELANTVEIGIRMKVRALPAASAASGTAWLEGRRESYRAFDRVSEELRRDLAGLFRRTCEERSAGQLSMYFLVGRRETAAFLSRCARLGGEAVVSGPWPPYNFVSW